MQFCVILNVKVSNCFRRFSPTLAIVAMMPPYLWLDGTQTSGLCAPSRLCVHIYIHTTEDFNRLKNCNTVEDTRLCHCRLITVNGLLSVTF